MSSPKPKRITAAALREQVVSNPSWCRKLKHPVVVTDYCDLEGSGIKFLSPLITFAGADQDGKSASFRNCKSLEVAEGVFKGFVDFRESGIKRIGALNIIKSDKQGNAASFASCAQLKVATGRFPGFVNFANSGIQRIHDLTVNKAKRNGSNRAASFEYCKKLREAQGSFAGLVDFSNSGIRKIGKIKITSLGTNPEESRHKDYAAVFTGCENLKVAEGSFPGGVDFINSGIVTIRNLRITKTSRGGPAAAFDYCYSLREASGNYPGPAGFSCSGVRKIGALSFSGSRSDGYVASFNDCPNFVTGSDFDNIKLGSKQYVWFKDELFSRRKFSARLEQKRREASAVINRVGPKAPAGGLTDDVVDALETLIALGRPSKQK